MFRGLLWYSYDLRMKESHGYDERYGYDHAWFNTWMSNHACELAAYALSTPGVRIITHIQVSHHAEDVCAESCMQYNAYAFECQQTSALPARIAGKHVQRAMRVPGAAAVRRAQTD